MISAWRWIFPLRLFAYLVVLMADLLLFLRREGGSSARQVAICVLGQIVEGILNWLEGVRQENRCQQNDIAFHTPNV